MVREGRPRGAAAARERAEGARSFSVTKWIHLNHGDRGVKELFKRVFGMLNEGGLFVSVSCWRACGACVTPRGTPPHPADSGTAAVAVVSEEMQAHGGWGARARAW